MVLFACGGLTKHNKLFLSCVFISNFIYSAGYIYMIAFLMKIIFLQPQDMPNPFAPAQKKCILCKYNVHLDYKVWTFYS